MSTGVCALRSARGGGRGCDPNVGPRDNVYIPPPLCRSTELRVYMQSGCSMRIIDCTIYTCWLLYMLLHSRKGVVMTVRSRI